MLTKVNINEIAINGSGIPNILIPRLYWQMLMLYAKEADGEIGGFSEVEKVEDNYKITSVHIVEQECTGTTTELKTEAVAKFFEQVHTEGKDPTKFRCWWHSHVDMSVFYSGEDVSTLNGLLSDWGDIAVGLTVNRSGQVYSRIIYNKPFTLLVENVPVYVCDEVSATLQEYVKGEVGLKVKKPVYSYQDSGYGKGHYRTPSGTRDAWAAGKKDALGRFGEWDMKQSLWRHSETGLHWDYDTQAWTMPKKDGISGMICNGCQKNFLHLKYVADADDWLCKPCRREFKKMTQEASWYPNGYDPQTPLLTAMNPMTGRPELDDVPGE